MTKDLAMLIGPDEPWLDTDGFMNAELRSPRGKVSRGFVHERSTSGIPGTSE